jgi:hypothetical protein
LSASASPTTATAWKPNRCSSPASPSRSRTPSSATLLGSYPAVYRQLAAEWAAGLALTVAAGAGPLLRMAVAADGPRLAAWLAGALFIPSLALLLGTASRTHRTFQALYVVLWYAVVNQVATADYMGTVLRGGRPAGPSPLLIAGVSAAMLAVTFAIRAARQASR